MTRSRTRIAVLGTVYLLVVFMLASVLLFGDALRHESQQMLKDAPSLVLQRLVAGRHSPIPASYLDQVRDVRGVASAHGRLWGYQFDANTGATITLMAHNDSHSTPPLAPDEVALGRALARAWDIGIGDTLTLPSADGSRFTFRIARLFSADSELLTADLLIMPEPRLRQFFALPADTFTDIAIDIPNPDEQDTVAGKLQRQLPDARAITRRDILLTYQSLFDWRSGMTLILLTGAIAAFLILAWDKASGLATREIDEIATLKAIGWDTADILTMKSWEGITLSLTATLGGITAAYLHVFHLGAPLLTSALKGWSTLYPDFQLHPATSLLSLTTLLFLTVVPYTLATVFPVWRSAITDPANTLR